VKLKRKLIALIMTLIMIVNMSSCLSNDKNEETTPDTTTKSTPHSETTPNKNEQTTPDNLSINTPMYERSQELDAIFTLLEEIATENDKMSFLIHFEGWEQELKANGAYYDYWIDAHFSVSVCCDYSKAVNEAWYPSTSPTDRKILNEAFYNSCKGNFTDGALSSSLPLYEGLPFTYNTPEDFLTDYTALEALLNLHYVTSLKIEYYFPYPIQIA
jgi:hypothetical protein